MSSQFPERSAARCDSMAARKGNVPVDSTRKNRVAACQWPEPSREIEAEAQRARPGEANTRDEVVKEKTRRFFRGQEIIRLGWWR